jgi:glycosyltransferase involved in cell wall biosynthesis
MTQRPSDAALPETAPAAEAVVVVMPAYNEAGCIEAVVREWMAAVGRMIVVNDGSRDETPRILDRLAAELPGLRVIHQSNAGHGAALLNGYRAAVAEGAEWVFQTDSDGQFLAADFPLLWNQRQCSPFLLGRREQRDDHPLRIWLSRVHALLLRGLFGVNLADPNVPYRLIHAPLLASYLPRIPKDTFAPNVLLSILAARDGHEPGFIPVSHRARQTGVVSIRGWKTFKVGLLVFRQLWAFRRALRSHPQRAE